MLKESRISTYFEKLLKRFSYERIDLVCNVSDGNLAHLQDQLCIFHLNIGEITRNWSFWGRIHRRHHSLLCMKLDDLFVLLKYGPSLCLLSRIV